MERVHLIYFPQSGIPYDFGSNPLAHLKMCFMWQSLFDLFMKNGEGAFNLFSSVAVESLQFLLSFLLGHFTR